MSLIHRLGRRLPRTTNELLDIASNHADGEEAVVATLNTPQGKGKQVMDHGKGTSSRFTKKKKKRQAPPRRQLCRGGGVQDVAPQGQPDQARATHTHGPSLPRYAARMFR
jgi:hypothetical protein